MKNSPRRHQSQLAVMFTLAIALPAAGLEAVTLFSDSFDRAENDDIDAGTDGIVNNTGSIMPGGSWNEVYGSERSHVSGNQLWLAHGFGSSNACIAHNFTNASILAAGEFSVTVDITDASQSTAGYGGGFGIGMAEADALASTDAVTGDPNGKKFQDAFAGSGNTAADIAISSFWLVLRGDGKLVWGTYGNAVAGSDESGLAGSAAVGSRTGTISATFRNIADFNAGTTVAYEVFFNGVSQGTGTFQWHGTDANYIGLDACDAGYVSLDNFGVITVPASSESWWHFEFPAGQAGKLVWQTETWRGYDLWFSGDLSRWTHVAGYPQPGTGGEMEHPFTPDTRGFFKITSEALTSGEFALIPAGSFQMGDQSDPKVGDSDELPVHSVHVSGFYMGKYEVTKALWDEVRAWGLSNGYTDLPPGEGKGPNDPDHPVHTLSWYDCVKWCNARSQREGLTRCYYTDDAHTTVYKTGNVNITNTMVDWTAGGYRLPSEAEWEKAARGGVGGRLFPWGDTINHSNANYYANGSAYTYDTSPYTSYTYHPDWDDGYSYTSPVGSFAPNGYGLYDMSGNLWEWCWDWYGSYPSGSQTDPHGPASGTLRVGRGGGWVASADGCRAAYRFNYLKFYPVITYYFTGFRMARSSVP